MIQKRVGRYATRETSVMMIGPIIETRARRIPVFSVCVWAMIVLGVIGPLCVDSSAEPTPAEVFEAMRGFDAVYGSGWYVAGTTARLKSHHSPGLPTYAMSFEFSVGVDRGALFLKAFDFEAPPTHAPGESYYAPFVRISSYYDEEVQGMTGIDYSGDAADYKFAEPIDYDRVDADISLNNNFGRNRDTRFGTIERALGRGYTRFALEVTQVQELANGALSVYLRSDEPIHGPGEWRLVVEPETGYLVRKAAYHRVGESDASILIHNEGLFESDDSISVPARGYYQDLRGSSNGVLPVVVNATTLAVDEELLTMTKSMLDLNEYKNAFLMDDTREKSRIVHKTGDEIVERTLDELAIYFDMSKLEQDMLESIIDAGIPEDHPAASEDPTPVSEALAAEESTKPGLGKPLAVSAVVSAILIFSIMGLRRIRRRS